MEPEKRHCPQEPVRRHLRAVKSLSSETVLPQRSIEVDPHTDYDTLVAERRKLNQPGGVALFLLSPGRGPSCRLCASLLVALPAPPGQPKRARDHAAGAIDQNVEIETRPQGGAAGAIDQNVEIETRPQGQRGGRETAERFWRPAVPGRFHRFVLTACGRRALELQSGGDLGGVVEVEIERLSDGLLGDLARGNVETVHEVRIVGQRLLGTLVGQIEDERQR